LTGTYSIIGSSLANATLPAERDGDRAQGLAERRNTPRICEPFPASAKGFDQAGMPYDTKTVLDNISAGGLYLRLWSALTIGAAVSVVFRLSSGGKEHTESPAVSVTGKVLRVEQKPGDTYGVAVAIVQYRFV
jgi:PilZ domain